MSGQSKLAEIIDEKERKKSSDKDYKKDEDIPKSEYVGIWKGAVREHNDNHIDFQMRSGDCISFDYPDRKFTNYSASESTIDIGFNDDLVTIYGRNLKPLYELLKERKAKWIREVDDPESEKSSESGIFVENIVVLPEGGDGSDE